MVWLDLELNPGLPGNWLTLYSPGRWAGYSGLKKTQTMYTCIYLSNLSIMTIHTGFHSVSHLGHSFTFLFSPLSLSLSSSLSLSLSLNIYIYIYLYIYFIHFIQSLAHILSNYNFLSHSIFHIYIYVCVCVCVCVCVKHFTQSHSHSCCILSV